MQERVNIVLVHDTLAHLVKEPNEWSSTDDSQNATRHHLNRWSQRHDIDISPSPWQLIALWVTLRPSTGATRTGT